MKEHNFWGEIKGWGDKRVYKNISSIGEPDCCLIFKGNTKKELNKFLRSKKVEINKENENLFVDTESEES